MPWQLGALTINRTVSQSSVLGFTSHAMPQDSTVSDYGPDVADQYDINPNKTEIWALWKEAGQVMAAKSGPGAS